MNIEETIEKYLTEKQDVIKPIMVKLLSLLSPVATKKGYDKPIKKRGDDGDEYYFINKENNEFVMVSLYNQNDPDDEDEPEIWVSWGRGDVKKNGKFDFAGSANDYYDSDTLKNIKKAF